MTEAQPSPMQLSFLIHSDGEPASQSILQAKHALAEAGLAKDCHYLFHGGLVPIESLMATLGVRVFSASDKLDPGRIKKIAASLAFFRWCCVIPLSKVTSELLRDLRAAGPENWRPGHGIVVFDRMLAWQEQGETPAAPGTGAASAIIAAATAEAALPAQAQPGKRFSVVIPTYNRIDILERTLRGYAEQTLRKDLFEVLVIDDGSTDATWQTITSLAKEMPYHLRCLRQANAGPGRARNLAMGEAKGEIILITGDDIIPAPDLLWTHHRTHLLNPGEGTAVLGKVDWDPKLVLTPLLYFITEKSSLQFGYKELESGQSQISYKFFYTSNISLKRSFLAGKELFRPEFVHAAYEDIELAYRLEKAGLKLVYDREAMGYHHHPMTIAAFCKRQYKAGLMANVFARMHPELAKDVGIEDARRLPHTAPALRNHVQAMMDAFANGPLGRYENASYREVPEKELNRIYEYISFVCGLHYCLGILEGEESSGKTPAVAASASAPTWTPAYDPVPANPVRDRALAVRLNAEGEQAFGEGNADAASLKFCAALDADEGFPDAYNNLGVVAWSQGKAEDARRMFRTAIACDPGYSAAQENLAAMSAPVGQARVVP